ncbi:MAG: L,D-transpeptidase [Ignavibacteriaceae bacterium]
MFDKIKEILRRIKESRIKGLLNINMIKNIILFSGGIIVFIFGVIVYGVILNLREPSLSEAMALKGFKELNNTHIIIERRSYTLRLYEDSVLIKTYKASFGRNINNPKLLKGDNATPVGEYIICNIDTVHKYYKYLRLNYPNLVDATEALRKGIISQKEFDELKFQFYYEDCPGSHTPIGGGIGIHGIGEYNSIFKNLPFVFNWTEGSIAVTNENIDEIYSVVKKGTKVVIK